MRKILNYFKPFDYVFIVLALLISFIPNIITSAQFSGLSENGQSIAIVKINGVIVDEFPLSEENNQIIKTYHPNDNQYNIIEIDNNRARIKEDNSPDQVGVRTGWISKPGQTAICLPHGFILEISGKMAEDELILPL